MRRKREKRSLLIHELGPIILLTRFDVFYGMLRLVHGGDVSHLNLSNLLFKKSQ